MSKGAYIGGGWQTGRGESFTSYNPATLAPVWKGKAADVSQVSDAVRAGREAFNGWSQLPLETRVACVEKFKAELEANADAFARVISEETGKLTWDAKGEVAAMVGKAAISIKAYHERTGVKETEQGALKLVLRHRPHGVMAVFGPYNFPGHLPNGHIMPALIAGNTIVFKPSEHTPLVAERMVELWHESGLPSGVLNLVPGGRETGIALAGDAGIDGILFTGSAEVGAVLHRQLAGRPDKILALEMGGNNALIVHEAKDHTAAALIALQSAFLSSGQRCTCARRLIVPRGEAGDLFIARLVEIARGVAVGAATDSPEPFMGPLISLKEAEKLMAAQEMLVHKGGRVLLPMRQPKQGYPFLTPGIVDATAISARDDKEYFGPLLQVIRVADFAAAISEANDTKFGLAAGLVSDDPALYERFLREIHAGIVNWNRPTNGASSAMPFGGVGVSGNHRPSAYYAADYCAYPMASMESPVIAMPDKPLPGVSV